MSSPAAHVSPAEYLALDAGSDAKVEYYDGVTVAMAGASPRHNRVAGNVYLALRRQLDPKGWYVAQADQRTRLAKTSAWVYPDVVVSCSPRFEGPRPQSLVSPELVVEVLSDSTEAHDLSAKLAHYRATESIAEIVFVRTRERMIEHHRRVDASRWLVTLATQGTVELAVCSLALDEVLAGMDELPDE